MQVNFKFYNAIILFLVMLLQTEVTQIIYYNSKQVYSIWFGNIYNRSLETTEENIYLKK